ncbi:hypothetical protein L1987_01758 [Smallanthus sonchifolius]|uniref:Uncharacterized protein n=1 Tax=Smallanthus sonchifolius TaxID=185202 RepID=A0ACB9K5Y1_9ASTR|nr:hypothetical protein L1987_01758 [Smallanthus sonchifolius]
MRTWYEHMENWSKISYAISAIPAVSHPYIEQFWGTAELDCRQTPNVITATVANQRIAISEATIRHVLQFHDQATYPITYPEYVIDGCWRQRMGYVGRIDYPSYKKGWLLDQWRYFAHILIMCISARKAGKDAMGHDLASAMVKRVDKRVFVQFLKAGPEEPIPVHTPLFGHLINEAHISPANDRWYSANSEPELSEHSDEEPQDEEQHCDSDSSDNNYNDDDVSDGDSRNGAEGTNSEKTVTESSDPDDVPDQRHLRRNIQESFPESSSKRQ